MYREGQTATNPKTGQKLIYRGGQWAPVGRLTQQEEIQLKEARESANVFADITDQATRFLELNKKASTGPVYAVPGASEVMGIFRPEIAQMDALTARMAPAQRVPGSGTTSDRDLALFLKAIPPTSRMGTANQGIVKDMQSLTTKRQQRAYLLDRYAQERGTLKGAEEAFQTYWRQKQASEKRPAPGPKTEGAGWKIVP
ncbi:hypothetical protein [Phenylobacterium sp. J367]|uniref:hypothetical protein n=1 Tax=Phenylobacterium sp. J367 TaxID=2898435 RepID=UPI0021510A4B|nr:hypothetical protein [Phenylobacterium sp. J367]MCR5881191.1 hypothetical protein [Phenylobacterium sp. J367]